MTEPSPPPDDQLVSDHLDGVAENPDALAGDAAARARLARFTEVRDLVAADVPVPPSTREAALTAALGVFDAEVPVAADGDPGDELADRRRRRWLAAPLIGAAASLLLMLGVLAGLQYGRGTPDQSAGAPAQGSADSALSASTLVAPAAGGAPLDRESPAAESQARPAGPPVSAGPGLPSELGTVDDAASFRRAIVTVLPRVLLSTTSSASVGEDSSSPVAGYAAGCEAALRADHPELGAVALRSTAQRGGAPLPVIAFLVPARPPAPPQTQAVRAFLVDPSSCRVVFDETV